MSHDKIIQAIRIYLKSEVTETPALGIFTSAGTSEIRIAEEPINGHSLSWASGLIAKDGIGNRSEGGDLSGGGCPVNFDGLSVEMINTNQYLTALAALGIYLPSLTVELIEFNGTELDADATSVEVMFTGVVEDMRGDEARLSIPIKNARYKRNAPMGVQLKENSTEIKPISFGNLYPPVSTVINNLAKMIRVDNEETIQDNADLVNNLGTPLPVVDIFPIVDDLGAPADLTYHIRYCDSGDELFEDSNPDDLYVYVVDGTGSGQIRKVTFISSVWVDQPESYDLYIRFTVSSYFETELIDNDDGEPERSWVQFKRVSGSYVIDDFPCKGFVDTSGNALTQDAQLFLYDNGKFNYIPSYGYDIDTSDTDNTSVVVSPDLCTDDITTVNSFKIAPVTALSLFEGDIEDLGFNALYGKINPGLYARSDGGRYAFTGTTPTLSNAANAIDKNSSTYAVAQFSDSAFNNASNVADYFLIVEIDLPEPPENFDFTECHLAIIADSQVTPRAFNLQAGATTDLHILTRRFYGGATEILDADYKDNYWDINSTPAIAKSVMDDMPDFYTIPNRSNNNLYAYKSPESETVYGIAGQYRTLRAFKTFTLNATNVNEYRSLKKLYIALHRSFSNGGDNAGNNLTDILTLAEVAIMFRKTGSIENEIYTPFKGRIFNDTWGTSPARKTAANLMEKPVDMLEHVCRLQDWSETGETGIEWGKEYATSALIKTGVAEGSFDSANLSTLTDQASAFQIFDEAKAYTDEIKKLICRVYNVCTYLDPNGTECVETMDLIDPVETITLDDLATDPGEIEEPKTERVFCEPVVNYQYNVGSGEYDKSLRVYNIQAYAEGGAWTGSSSGFASQADAEEVLDIYAALWNRFHTVEKCPSDFSDTLILTTYAAAKAYIIRKGNAMGKQRTRQVVNYAKGKDYHFAKHVMLNLPHQTNGADKECIIENVTAIKNQNRVECDLLLLE